METGGESAFERGGYFSGVEIYGEIGIRSGRQGASDRQPRAGSASGRYRNHGMVGDHAIEPETPRVEARGLHPGGGGELKVRIDGR
jgi:hypothetical protein